MELIGCTAEALGVVWSRRTLMAEWLRFWSSCILTRRLLDDVAEIPSQAQKLPNWRFSECSSGLDCSHIDPCMAASAELRT